MASQKDHGTDHIEKYVPVEWENVYLHKLLGNCINVL